MKIDFRKPKMAIPLIALPFLLIFFYAYRSLTFTRVSGAQSNLMDSDSLQGSIAPVSDQVKSQPLASKLSTYRQQYRDGDGYTAIKQLQEDQLQQYRYDELYTRQEKQKLDSLEKALKQQSTPVMLDNSVMDEQDIAVQQALSALSAAREEPKVESPAPDPMELFRMQMAYADSMAKANDPELQEKIKLESRQKEIEQDDPTPLPVTKYDAASYAFNTLQPQKNETPIQAIIDQTVSGTVDSRVRIRLLDDMLIDGRHIPAGTYLYAHISGFSGQRVMLSITSILWGKTILPLKLEVYDNDAGKGLYVPASAFREFSKELGGNSTQGLSLQQQAAGNSQMVMGALQRMFQSTSSAVSKHIRKNKATLKYNSLVYLIDGGQHR